MQVEPIIVDELSDDDSTASGILLRQEYCMGSDDIGKQPIFDARCINYSQNCFKVPLHWLGEFMSDSLAVNATAVSVPSLVATEIRVIVDLHSPSNSLAEDENSKRTTEMAASTT